MSESVEKQTVLEQGDRVCPNCETLNLIEEGLTKWKCLHCEELYDETWLEGDIDEMDEE